MLLSNFKDKLAAIYILSGVCIETCLDLCDPKGSCPDSVCVCVKYHVGLGNSIQMLFSSACSGEGGLSSTSCHWQYTFLQQCYVMSESSDSTSSFKIIPCAELVWVWRQEEHCP